MRNSNPAEEKLKHYKALYDYDAQRNDELSLKAGDMVDVLQHDSEEWCTAENIETGQQGAVPTNYLEKLNHTVTTAVKDKGSVLAKVLQDYAAQDREELSLWKDGIVTVLDQTIAEGWWKGDLNGNSGIFPANHVKIIDSQEMMSPNVADENDAGQRQSFKLAAYGVKQGGIGSILAGGFSLRKKGHKREESGPELVESSPEQQVKATDANTGTTSGNEHAKAMVINAYDPENDDELKLLPGAYVTITDKMNDQGWWKGTNESNEQGIFPSNFVQLISPDGIPARPARARPPTIMTDSKTTSAEKNHQQSVVSPTSMAKPPPVPVGTRPSSLLTRRPTTNGSDQVATTTIAPAPRPITSPPVPTRRTNSVIKDSSQPVPQPRPRSQAHKRTPSIPLVSPDLPPIRLTHSHEQHPVRPSRPVPSPASPSIVSPTSPISDDRTIGLAKVPKNFGKSPSGPPPRVSRPNSLASSISTMNDSVDEPHAISPRAPKRSVPSVPPRTTQDDSPLPAHSRESSSSSKHDDIPALHTPPSPIPSSRLSPKKESADPLENMLRQWFKDEAESMRRDFEAQLDEERLHRLKLEAQVEELKRQLM
ncbi:hypothetical protein [Absidia glauca]|uniref:SH3 domain-containing protein n=1 Tax=Absidia glauca TaxID=4829 RepID=A0A163JB25_ABSGL|nr:hypothetical protein [Absidia glauca]